MMKLRKKALLCLTGLFLAGLLVAQMTDSASNSAPATTSNAATASSETTPATNSATPPNQANQDASSDLVVAIEEDGDLNQVAEALFLSGTDALLVATDEAFTIFAPVDGSFDQGVVLEDVITDYIVPVVIDTSTMDDTSSIIAMSGEPVTFTYVDEVLEVNGVPVLDEQAIYSDNVVVYKLADSFDSDSLASTK